MIAVASLQRARQVHQRCSGALDPCRLPIVDLFNSRTLTIRTFVAGLLLFECNWTISMGQLLRRGIADGISLGTLLLTLLVAPSVGLAAASVTIHGATGGARRTYAEKASPDLTGQRKAESGKFSQNALGGITGADGSSGADTLSYAAPVWSTTNGPEAMGPVTAKRCAARWCRRRAGWTSPITTHA